MNGIRKLKEEEVDECLDLSAFAFQYKMNKEEKAKKRVSLQWNEYWGYFIDNKLAAKLRIIPLSVFIQGRVFAMGGIASVATWPEYRRNGLVGKLMSHSLREMKEQGQTISVLHPFSFAFYRKYGWENYTEYKQYHLDRAQLPIYTDTLGIMKRIDEPIAHLQLFQEIYTKYATEFDGMLNRDENWWKTIVFAKHNGLTAIYYDPEGVPLGYLLYDVINNEMKIAEMVYLNETARQAMWKFIQNHDSMINQVSITVPQDDLLPFLLHDPRIKQEIKPYMMARIVDAQKFLTQFPFASMKHEQGISFTLDLSDEHAEWNNETFDIHIDHEGNAAVKVSSGDLIANQPSMEESLHCGTISCSIQTLSTMMIGYQRPSVLNTYGRLLGDTEVIEWLEYAIPRRTMYFIDFF